MCTQPRPGAWVVCFENLGVQHSVTVLWLLVDDEAHRELFLAVLRDTHLQTSACYHPHHLGTFFASSCEAQEEQLAKGTHVHPPESRSESTGIGGKTPETLGT